jgi:hypothetical protein
MKYEKGSLMDKILSQFPVRYLFYLGILWVLIIIGLIYLWIKF